MEGSRRAFLVNSRCFVFEFFDTIMLCCSGRFFLMGVCGLGAWMSRITFYLVMWVMGVKWTRLKPVLLLPVSSIIM